MDKQADNDKSIFPEQQIKVAEWGYGAVARQAHAQAVVEEKATCVRLKVAAGVVEY